MLKLLILFGFLALTNSDDNQLVLGYGCNSEICQFSIEVDEVDGKLAFDRKIDAIDHLLVDHKLEATSITRLVKKLE